MHRGQPKQCDEPDDVVIVVRLVGVVRTGRRLMAPFSGRPLTAQHAGAHDLFVHNVSSPAAKHLIDPAPLQRLVRRHDQRTGI